VTEALWAGLVAGYGIAVPVGALAPLLVGLSARGGLRVGAAAALGVATADGLYALLAVVGGVALAEAIEPVSRPLRLLAAGVLAVIAVRTVAVAVRNHRRADAAAPRAHGGALGSPGRAYVGLLGLTMLNPATVVYFAALVLGERAPSGGGTAGVFVVAAFAASASWQLALAGGGAALGRVLTSPRGRLGTALASSAVVAALALAVLVGA
jgi:arginine exporter protein ArgO